ncbi:hypothetical protein K402DRAFT_191923 [Aulographum hederae CBS 113979]|uniref:Uncharacterized protein n=1 Tax=Aulographum hederae CBS 113979 TaxID=1176131 RepID=A0A6G1GPA5_9PEZI|nr:hypothetical protein K402DRAFT_191923 [Aulographum hederae CBS 113979]
MRGLTTAGALSQCSCVCLCQPRCRGHDAEDNLRGWTPWLGRCAESKLSPKRELLNLLRAVRLFKTQEEESVFLPTDDDPGLEMRLIGRVGQWFWRCSEMTHRIQGRTVDLQTSSRLGDGPRNLRFRHLVESCDLFVPMCTHWREPRDYYSDD